MHNQQSFRLMAAAFLFMPWLAHAGLFSSGFGEFRELAEAGKVEEAVLVIKNRASTFESLSPDKRAYVDAVLARRDESIREKLSEVYGALILAENETARFLRWKRLREAMPAARKVLTDVSGLTSRGPLTQQGITVLSAALDRITAGLQAQAPKELLEYGIFNEPSFISQYPVPVNLTRYPELKEAWVRQMDQAGAAQLARFNALYGKAAVSLGLGKYLAERYARALIREERAYSFLHKLDIYERLRKAGYDIGDFARQSTLIASWPIPDAAVAGYGFRPADPAKADFRQLERGQPASALIHSGVADNRDLVVFIRAVPLPVNRDDLGSETVASQFQSGSRRIDNPDYQSALQELRDAEAKRDEINRLTDKTTSDPNSSLGMFAAVVGVTALVSADNAVDKARQALESTPRQIDQPVLAPYSFSRQKLKLAKVVDLHYAVYDTGTGLIRTGKVTSSFSEDVQVLHGVRNDDPRRDALLQGGLTPEGVERWTGATLTDSYDSIWSRVLADYRQRGSEG